MSKPTEAEIADDYETALAHVIEIVGPETPELHFLDRDYRRAWFIEQRAASEGVHPGS